MRTIEQAIEEETRRYLAACSEASYYRGADDIASQASLRRARIHSMARTRLRHYLLTDHEAVCRATLTTHAYSDLDGYGA